MNILLTDFEYRTSHSRYIETGQKVCINIADNNNTNTNYLQIKNIKL